MSDELSGDRDRRVPLDSATRQAWVEVAHGARWARRVLSRIGEPAPESSFAAVNSLFIAEKASDWHRSYLGAALEHLVFWADQVAPLRFHPDQVVEHSLRPALTLGRAALEASSQAVWMSSGASAQECLRRHLSLVRWDYAEHRKSTPDAAARARIGELDAKLLERVKGLFDEEDLRAPRHLAVLRAAAPVADLDPDDVERLWRSASGAAHGKSWPALELQHVVPIEEHEPGQFRVVRYPDPAAMTSVLRAAERLTMYGVLRHADFAGAHIADVMDEARRWLASVVPHRDDADPAVLAQLARPADASG